MPVYEYRCQKCGSTSEHLRPMSDRNLPAPCQAPGCDGQCQHILSLPAVHIDGSDPTWPSAAAKWDRDRERRMAQERKNLERHGTYT